MRALVVFCHPKTDSYNAAVLDVVLSKLRDAGAEIRISDLYRSAFQPVLSGSDLDRYLSCAENADPVCDEVAKVRWCDTLIFIYPTWWYGLPAMLKGWLDRVLLPGVAFHMPDDAGPDIRPGLRHISRLGVFTTCGASRGLTALVGAPGRRTLLRGLGILCSQRCRKRFAAHYRMDSSTPKSRTTHLARVGTKMDGLLSEPRGLLSRTRIPKLGAAGDGTAGARG
ncbi:MAG: NAD(P)H-dependent oxidoreductase [Rhodobacteraceae bacterium]|nr:NAD(P)H-dependent oxidoreductase [Paracoccaceae bacterium]